MHERTQDALRYVQVFGRPTFFITFTCNPKWETNNVFDFPIEVVHGQELLMEFYDDDSRKDDEFMGRAKIQTNLVAQRGHIEVSVLMWKCV